LVSWVGSEGRVYGSGARIEFLIRAKTPFAFAFVRQRGAAVAAGQRNELWGNVLHFVGLYRPPTPSRRCDFQFGVWYSSVCSAIVVCIGLCGAAARRSHFVPHTLALRRTTWLSIALGPFWLLRCPPSRASSPKQESVPLLPAPVSACRRVYNRSPMGLKARQSGCG